MSDDGQAKMMGGLAKDLLNLADSLGDWRARLEESDALSCLAAGDLKSAVKRFRLLCRTQTRGTAFVQAASAVRRRGTVGYPIFLETEIEGLEDRLESIFSVPFTTPSATATPVDRNPTFLRDELLTHFRVASPSLRAKRLFHRKALRDEVRQMSVYPMLPRLYDELDLAQLRDAVRRLCVADAQAISNGICEEPTFSQSHFLRRLWFSRGAFDLAQSHRAGSVKEGLLALPPAARSDIFKAKQGGMKHPRRVRHQRTQYASVTTEGHFRAGSDRILGTRQAPQTLRQVLRSCFLIASSISEVARQIRLLPNVMAKGLLEAKRATPQPQLACCTTSTLGSFSVWILAEWLQIVTGETCARPAEKEEPKIPKWAWQLLTTAGNLAILSLSASDSFWGTRDINTNEATSTSLRLLLPNVACSHGRASYLQRHSGSGFQNVRPPPHQRNPYKTLEGLCRRPRSSDAFDARRRLTATRSASAAAPTDDTRLGTDSLVLPDFVSPGDITPMAPGETRYSGLWGGDNSTEMLSRSQWPRRNRTARLLLEKCLKALKALKLLLATVPTHSEAQPPLPAHTALHLYRLLQFVVACNGNERMFSTCIWWRRP